MLWGLLLCAGTLDTVSATALGVVYPDTPPPYSAVFEALVAGLEHGARGHGVHRLKLGDGDDAKRLTAWLRAQRPERVIALGRRAYEAYVGLPGARPPPIIGALDATPDTHPGVSGISLSVDPDLLFELLNTLKPQTRRVLVVLNPARDVPLAHAAERAARAHGLMLEVYAASTLKESTAHFDAILRYANPDTDALWLTVDGALVDPNINLASIISQSWARRFTVFSNNLEHVDRGVLFSLYPDPYALGQRLARLALDEAPAGLQPLRDVKRAFNQRVARHLGVVLTGRVRKRFDLILGDIP